MAKTDTRKLNTETLEVLRKQAIRLLKAGETQKKIAAIIAVREATCHCERSVAATCRWVKRCEEGGLAALKPQKRGRPKGFGKTLSPEQEKKIERVITDKTPDQLKLPFGLWRREAVQELIRELYGIRMPIRTKEHVNL